MRKPSPEDMIYAGLVLRLGLTTEEELNQFTRSSENKDASFIDIILQRGIINQDQLRTVQEMLAQAERSPVFRKKALGGGEANPVVDQMAIPTMVLKPGESSAATISIPTQGVPSEAPTGRMDSSEMPTVAAPTPPRISSSGFAKATTSPGLSSAAIDWSTLSGSLTNDEINKAAKSRETYGDHLIGTQLGGYALLDKLGKGGMGEVYLAKQLTLNRYVALKVLPKAISRNKDFVARFIREAQTLARVNFPSIIQVYDVGVEGEIVFFTMELVRGRNIQDVIKETGKLPVEMAINIIKQSCRALARVAREAIVHRDIKPSNIMITEEAEIKVCDFGIASEKLDKASIKEVFGTPYYIAPEYLSGEECTSLSDQYSLGVSFYHMLSGMPTGKTGMFALDPDVARLSDKDSSVPQEISDIIARMTQAQPADRFAKFEDVFHALENYELRAGIIKAPSEFLAERLVSMREMGWDQIKKWVAVFAMVAAGFTALAMILNRIILRASIPRAIGLLGGWGTLLILTAYGMILYVGLARKRFLPALGNLRQWVRTHYSIALAGYFLVMVHSGNFLGWPLLKKTFGVIPGLGAANWNTVPTVSFLSSIALFLVIISGLIGRFIFRELHKQVALEQFGGRENLSAEERQSLTRLVISTRIMGYWRVLHYPMTVFMILLVLLHVISVMYYGGGFFGR